MLGIFPFRTRQGLSLITYAVPMRTIFKCLQCVVTFTSKSGKGDNRASLKKHLVNVHNCKIPQKGAEKFCCRFCNFLPPQGKAYPLKAVKSHVEKEHADALATFEREDEAESTDLPFKCSFPGCKESFPRSGSLARHMNNHKKPAVDCGKSVRSCVLDMISVCCTRGSTYWVTVAGSGGGQ